MIYRKKFGAHLAVPAQVAGEECARLEAEGRLTPRNLVDESRPEDAPLHKCFEWDDGIAAEKYREVQAGRVIRAIEVVIEKHEEPVRAFHPVITTEKREYRSINAIIRNVNDKQVLLDSAKREMLAFIRKYKGLAEVCDVVSAMQNVIDSQLELELSA